MRRRLKEEGQGGCGGGGDDEEEDEDEREPAAKRVALGATGPPGTAAGDGGGGGPAAAAAAPSLRAQQPLNSAAESTSSGDEDEENERPMLGAGGDGSGSSSSSSTGPTASALPIYNSVSQRLMAKMGFREGEGLGKHGQGRKEIIEASTQRGRRGLGLTLPGFEGSLEIDWRSEPEPSADEQVKWLPESSEPPPIAEHLQRWMQVGPKKHAPEDEVEFCDLQTIHNVLRCKSVFDELDGEEMRKARTRSNPYETIRGVIFLNRASVKMANMDCVFDFMFTNPKDKNGQPLVNDKGGELLYFADVCAGPGGFSEYVLWRRSWHAKGFGLTLRGPNDFKLEDFFAAPSEMFEAHYGVNGVDGDGDITRSDNIEEFRRFVLCGTEGRGVHFLMADGGFSVEGQENLQEILSKQLLLCQALVALSVLRKGGHFVCKTFDLFTRFSVGVIYLLYRCFSRVCLFKPVTSRPANSERYVVCRGLRGGVEHVREFMLAVNAEINRLKGGDDEVLEIVPLSTLKGDQEFFSYVCSSNESHAKVQVLALAKIHAFALEPTLYEPRQAEVRKACLERWGIPDKARVARPMNDPKSKFAELIEEKDVESFGRQPLALTSKSMEKLRPVLDYRCMVAGGEHIFLIGLGKTQIYSWDGRQPVRWRKPEGLRTELPRDTLLLVETVQELRGEGRAQRRVTAIHILDALILCGTDVRSEHFNMRMQMAEKFVKAIAKPSRSDMNPIRVKERYRLEEIDRVFLRLEMKVTKSSGGMPKLSYTGQDDRHFLPSGLYFVRTTRDPWCMAYSKNSRMKYFFNREKNQSTFEIPPESVATFSDCHATRLLWSWAGARVHDSQAATPHPDHLNKEDVLQFVREHYRP
ncbi:cap-specific mRNA (nucleoside-2'-O-)-methyltransferase 1 isoform X2 [Lethenteron reissneri]|uniref:cap-specific mRNA (nucleoside-2'-O-)-methyltransferase 1 isoform X2 n=1 Tax=Lethenteron reissneri TaxID=7753 RepID=UPI002AB6CCE0|nr:cap-specific mRNA (nucleoside-2'-O-)-methyltransferase 1 isoform X2 [Lethenteron reissneri]